MVHRFTLARSLGFRNIALAACRFESLPAIKYCTQSRNLTDSSAVLSYPLAGADITGWPRLNMENTMALRQLDPVVRVDWLLCKHAGRWSRNSHS